MDSSGEWVLMAYRLPREPSTPRISVWRKLRRLGAAQLLDGLVALPLSARNRERLEWLAEEVREAGGEASIWLAHPAAAGEERAVMARMREVIEGEYRAVVEEVRTAGEADPATRRRTLARLRRELQQIRERDYFSTVEREKALRAVEELAASVEMAQ